MRKMKDSGLQWIGNIPEEWTVGRVKDVISLLTDYTANGSFGDLAKNVQYLDDGYARLVRLTDLRENLTNANGIFIDEPTFNYLAKSKLKSGDILVANVGAYSGLFCEMPKVEYPCSLAPNMFLIRTNKRMIQHFLFYVGSSNFVWEQLVQKAVSSAQPKLNKTDIKTTFLPIPPIDEQKKIADFLDERCGEIDSIRSDIQKQIDILNDYKKSVITEAVTKGLDPKAKLKDSGIEWIGKIPEGWTIVPINYLTTSRSGGTPDRNKSQYWEEGTIPWMASGEVNKFLVYDTKEKITELATRLSNAKIVPANSVMVALNGQGKTKGMSAVLKIDAACNQSLCAFQCDPMRLNYMYLLYCFQSMYKFLRFQAGDDVRDGLAASFVKKQRIPLPSLNEQNEIASFIDEKCSAIDATIADKQKQLETLDEYKKSLIFEYVTGKKEVPA